MRSFGPSLIALSAGLMWVVVFTQLMPAKEPPRLGRAEVSISAAAMAPCTGGNKLAELPEVAEASGLTVSRRNSDVLWTHNDSGQPILYAVGIDGKLRGRVRVTGAQMDDWEDVSVGPCPQGSCIYIADIGDNKNERRAIAIYRVPEPAPGETATQEADVFYATYPDQPQDAEAFFVDPRGTMFVVTKGEGSPISLYRFAGQPAPGSTTTLQRVATLAGHAKKPMRITDADMSWDGKWVVLRTLDELELYKASDLLSGHAGTPLEYDLTPLAEPQGEGLAVARDGTVYLVGEARNGIGGGTLARLSCKLP